MKLVKILVLVLALACVPAQAQYIGDVSYTGQAAFGGNTYSHVIVSSGYGLNPLTAYSQVGFWTYITCNSYATQHCGGFESSNGLADGLHTQRMDAFGVANPHMGVGSIADRFIQFAYSESLAGTNNAIIAAVDDNSFTGNWFINYRGSLPSKIMGDLGVGRGAGRGCQCSLDCVGRSAAVVYPYLCRRNRNREDHGERN